MHFRALLLTTLVLVSSLQVARAARDEAIDAAADAVHAAWPDAPMLVLGELHGTRETPALTVALARRLASQGPLQVALEIPAEEQARLDAWLASDGGADARAALLAGAFWQRPRDQSDGRRSEAMLGLLDALRELRRERASLQVIGYDGVGFYGKDRDRDEAMAQSLRRALLATPAARMLVLTGNYHARLSRPDKVSAGGIPYMPPAPMASHLQDLGAITIDLGAREGEFWACRAGSCGVQTLRRSVPASTPLLQVGARHDYHASLTLPRLSYSEPVVTSATTTSVPRAAH